MRRSSVLHCFSKAGWARLSVSCNLRKTGVSGNSAHTRLLLSSTPRWTFIACTTAPEAPLWVNCRGCR